MMNYICRMLKLNLVGTVFSGSGENEDLRYPWPTALVPLRLPVPQFEKYYYETELDIVHSCIVCSEPLHGLSDRR
jgi:hypothetical protein